MICIGAVRYIRHAGEYESVLKRGTVFMRLTLISHFPLNVLFFFLKKTCLLAFVGFLAEGILRKD